MLPYYYIIHSFCEAIILTEDQNIFDYFLLRPQFERESVFIYKLDKEYAIRLAEIDWVNMFTFHDASGKHAFFAFWFWVYGTITVKRSILWDIRPCYSANEDLNNISPPFSV
jgi:hypothetical protein